MTRYDQRIRTQSVAGADHRAEISFVRGAVKQNEKRILRESQVFQLVFTHFNDCHELGGVLFFT